MTVVTQEFGYDVSPSFSLLLFLQQRKNNFLRHNRHTVTSVSSSWVISMTQAMTKCRRSDVRPSPIYVTTTRSNLATRFRRGNCYET